MIPTNTRTATAPTSSPYGTQTATPALTGMQTMQGPTLGAGGLPYGTPQGPAGSQLSPSGEYMSSNMVNGQPQTLIGMQPTQLGVPTGPMPTGPALPGNMLQPPQRQFPGRGQPPRQGRWGQMPPQAQGQPWSSIGQGRPGGNSMPAPAPTPTYHQNPLGPTGGVMPSPGGQMPMPQQQGYQQQPIMQPTPPIVPQQMSSDAMSAALRRQY